MTTAKLEIVKATFDPQLVAWAEDLLASAKAGEFCSGVAVMMRPERGYSVISSGCDDLLRQAGALASALDDTIKRTKGQ